MLDFGDQVRALVETVGPLRCEVNLPRSWKDELGQVGPLPLRYVERRRHPRFHFRVCAALEHGQTFPSLPRANVWYQVFTKHLSRGGISFLHSEQLFPRERMRIVLPERGMSAVEIVWCARVQERCFQVGARFVERIHKFSE